MLIQTNNKTNKVIGIDLGTTNSCLSIAIGDDFKIIENKAGFRTTPSVVSVINGVREVGLPAKQQGAINPRNVFFATKRLIGKTITEINNTPGLKEIFPFEIVDIGDNTPGVRFEDEGKQQTISVVEISTHILSYLKGIADSYLKKNVTKAVITVPAYFNDIQRVATKNAGKLAGLEVERIINEPTAAALAYGLGKSDKTENVLIYDLGGGTFDVTALVIDKGVFEIKATGGDTQLGGEDFDHVLFNIFIKEYFEIKFPNLKLNEFSKKRLIEKLEEVKKGLSFKESKDIIRPFFIHEEDGTPVNLQHTITRKDFERASSKLIKRTIDTIKNVIKDSGFKKEDFHQIVLVGGITRIPKVSEAIKKFLGRDDLNNSINVDECVAIGAAIQGSIISPTPSSKAKDLLLLDVIPLSLGLETHGDGFHVLIPRNSQVPTEKSGTFTTVVDNQENVEIKIFQGERKIASENNLVKSFVFNITPNTKRGIPQIEVKYILDANGILTVTATEDKNTINARVTLGAISREQIEAVLENAAKFKAKDEEKLELIQGTNRLRDIHSDARAIITEIEEVSEVSEENKKKLEELKTISEETITEQAKKLLDNPTIKDIKEITTKIQTKVLIELNNLKDQIKPASEPSSTSQSEPKTGKENITIDKDIIRKIREEAERQQKEKKKEDK